MEKVLLAIDGTVPDKKAFRYAVQLCRRIEAELRVLQIVDSKKYGKYFEKARKKADPARKYIEGSLAAAAFAEAGEHETAENMMSEALKNLTQLLPESEKAGIPYSLTMKMGNPKNEILNYLDEHRDVVLAIYGTPQEKQDETGFVKKNRLGIREVKQLLTIPLVVVRHA
jgi:nucleotide-binding universal stress UspA family protein